MFFDIAAIIFVVLFSLYMMKKGGVKAILSLVSFVLAIIIATLCYPVLTEAVYATDLPMSVESAIGDVLHEKGEEAGIEAIDAMPDFVRNSIEIDEEEALDEMIDKATKDISRLVINVINFILVVIITKIILAFLIGALNITTKLPVIHQLNSLVGLLGGVVISLGLVWLTVCAVGVVAASNPTVAEFVKGSYVVSIMSNIAPF
ncbi:MAG: CvpA family protein [Clostridia bacterium]|nr:CvpA family protein [Clostridia bacterium]